MSGRGPQRLDPEDLIARARRGLLSPGEQRELARALRESEELRVAYEVGRDLEVRSGRRGVHGGRQRRAVDPAGADVGRQVLEVEDLEAGGHRDADPLRRVARGGAAIAEGHGERLPGGGEAEGRLPVPPQRRLPRPADAADRHVEVDRLDLRGDAGGQPPGVEGSDGADAGARGAQPVVEGGDSHADGRDDADAGDDDAPLHGACRPAPTGGPA